MGLAEEEVLIRDDSGLLLDTSDVRIPRSQAWTRKLTRTICLSLGFLVLGLCVAIPGPTLLDLEDQVKAMTSQMMIVFASRSLGYLLGALLGGMLFDCFDKQLLLFCTLLISSVATVVIPWSLTLVVMATMFALQGITMGVLDTGGNIYCIQLWGKKNGPFIQTLHFAFGIGAFVAPLLARPFLSSGAYVHNTTEIVQGNIPVAPFLHEHHVQNMSKRSVLDMFEELDEFHREVSNDIDLTHKHVISLYKRDSSGQNLPIIHIGENYVHADYSNLHSIVKRQILGKLLKRDDQSGDVPSPSDKSDEGSTPDDNEIKVTSSPEVETSTSVDNTSKAVINITDSIKQVNNSGENVDSVTSSSVAPVHVTTASTSSTTVEETVKKPSAATDKNRGGDSADGQPISKHLDDHKNDASPEVVSKPTTPIDTESKDIVNGSNNNNVNITNDVENIEAATTNSSNITVINSTVPTTQKQDPGTPQTLTVAKVTPNNTAASTNVPAVATAKPDDNITASTNDDTKKPTTDSSSSFTSTTNSTTTTSTTTTSTAKPSITTRKASTTTSTTTTKPTTTTTTTTKPPPPTTTKPTTTSTKSTTTTTTTIKPATKRVTSPDITKTSKNPLSSDKAVASKISTDKPNPTDQAVTVTVKSTSSILKTTMNGSSINDTSVQSVTEIPLKPGTTDDSFLHHAIAAVKNISRIQIAYGIIGLLLFLIAIVFLVLYCRDKGKISVSADFDELERYRSIDSCTKSSLIVLLGFFFFSYMGLEVTFGALVTTFTVEYNHWPKEQGAVVAAIFWGSLATGRGLSIFISRCCGPTFMLAFDLVFMIIGGLVLAVGVPYFDKLLWLGTLILGLGMSSAFPAGITWAETKFHLSGKSTAVFVIGSAIGQMGIPILSGYLYETYGAMSLMYITVALTLMTLLIFIIMQCVAFRNGSTLKVNARNGFLPLEDDEDDETMEMDDLVHFDKSQTRTLRDRRSRGDAKYHTLISDLEDD